MKKWKRYLATVLAAVLTVSTLAGAVSQDVVEVQAADTTTLPFDYNTQWRYLDDNSTPDANWKNADFDDSSWQTNGTSQAKFGAKKGAIGGIGNYTPVVLLDGCTATNDYPTYYFRAAFNLTEIPKNQSLQGSMVYDDGAVIYLNGTKIASYNMPEGEFDNSKYLTDYDISDQTAAVTFTVSSAELANLLKTGENVIAVELHQQRVTSSDIYFEMSSLKFVEETAADAVTQKAVCLTVGSDETSRNITWYANVNDEGTLQYIEKGTDETFPENGYTEVKVTDPITTNDSGFYSYQATMSGLEAGKTYLYRVVNKETVSDTYSFTTSGNDDGSEDFHFLVVGDPQIGASGNATNDTAGWDKTLEAATKAFPGVAFLLSAGDQVNTASNESQYAGYLEHTTLKSLTTATVIGNHDSSSAAYRQHFNNPNESIAYGETTAGSDYWFVYNNVLFMSLNSNDQSTAEHQAFMKAAIEANPNVDWKVVTFHHSIYSVANHASETDILNRRTGLVPVFAELDIDVVLMGHDHVYVRSYMMDGLTPITDASVYDNTEYSSITNPDGILYVTFNSGSGSKTYNIKNETFDYAAVKNQEYQANYSNVEVTENSFKVTTYRTNDNSVVDEFTIYHEPETTKTVATEQIAGKENGTASLDINKIAEYDSETVNEDGGSAEIVQYNSDNQMYYVVNGTTGTLDIVPREVYTEDNKAEGFKFDLKTKLINYRTDFKYGDMTSVAVNTDKDLIAIAVQAAGTNDSGLIVLMNYDNEIVAVIDAGVQPDMVTFTSDGNKVLSANEGEPRDGYGAETTDPMGSITVADLSEGFDKITAKNIDFTSWDEKRAELTKAGVIIKKNTAPSVDFEPEYIAVSSDNKTAYVSLQEANAIAKINLIEGEVAAINSLGFKDHSLVENALDMAKDDTINIKSEEVYGIYMPDGIALYEVGGVEYLITANEGDSREWGDYLNEKEIKINGNKVVTFDVSDYDGLDDSKTYLFGGRSFSVYKLDGNSMTQVYDSGSDFEAYTAKYFADYFNCSNDKNSMDNRSGKKGPEAESVVTGTVGDKTYAFIGLERIGGVMVYDITDPDEVSFVNYINSRDFSEKIAGDVSPEGLSFVPAANSYSGQAELIVANEVSGTVAIYQMKANIVSDDDTDDNKQNGNVNGDNNSSNEGTTGTSNTTGTQNSTNNGSSSVATGDSANFTIWGIMLAVGVLAFLGAVFNLKKRQGKN